MNIKNFSINWKTTLAGAIAIFVQIGPVLFPKTITPRIANTISVIAVAVGLGVAKDANVTGVGATATTIEQDAIPVLKVADQLSAGSSNITIQDVHSIIDKLTALIPVPPPPAPVAPVAPIAAPGTLG